MIPKLYMDEHVHGTIVLELRSRGVDVMTAREDRHDGNPDAILLERATMLGRMLVPYDVDFLRESAIRAAAGRQFSGIVYVNPNTITLGNFLYDLEAVCTAGAAEEYVNAVVRLPL